LTKASFRAAILLTEVSKMAFVVRSVSRHAKLRGGLLMNPKTAKKALKDAIQAMTDYKWLFSARPGKDNTRNRKFPFQKVIPFILAFRGGTLNHEIMDFFGLDSSTGTSSAFIYLFPCCPSTRCCWTDGRSAIIFSYFPAITIPPWSSTSIFLLLVPGVRDPVLSGATNRFLSENRKPIDRIS